MPKLEFVELHTQSDLDRRRQRVSVRVHPGTGGRSRLLGDVWRSTATGRWHFTTNASNLRRGDTAAGHYFREEAAQALFEARIAAAESQVQDAVTDANALREAAGVEPLIVSAGATAL